MQADRSERAGTAVDRTPERYQLGALPPGDDAAGVSMDGRAVPRLPKPDDECPFLNPEGRDEALMSSG